MKAKVKNTLIAVGLLAVGYAAGIIIAIPDSSGNMAKGDISKVSMFRKAIIQPEYSAFEAKLLNDTLAREEESLSKDILVLKLQEFADLVDRSISVAGDIEELQNEVNALRQLKEMSLNAAKAGEVANAAFDNLQNGNKEDLGISYEQASQNMAVAYMLIDKQVRTGKEFAIAADEYFVKHSDMADLESVRDSWALFCCENAFLNGDKQEQKFWVGNKNVHIADSKLIKVIAQHNGALEAIYGPVLQKIEGGALGERTQSSLGQKVENSLGMKAQKHLGEKEAEVLAQQQGEALGKKAVMPIIAAKEGVDAFSGSTTSLVKQIGGESLSMIVIITIGEKFQNGLEAKIKNALEQNTREQLSDREGGTLQQTQRHPMY